MSLEATRWIRAQAASGSPLNLHSVMRERPDLLKKAFAGPSPRGWRRILIEAGVDPYKIVHAYEDLVHCAICGYSSAVLGVHLKLNHGMTREEYVQEFGPACEVSSESFRTGKFSSRPVAGIAHWEGLWSRHYVIDWIIRLREEGRDLNFFSLKESGRNLAYAGLKLFGSWDQALLAAGFNPVIERALPPYQQWTEDLLIERLREFALERKANRKLMMSNELRIAVLRMFGTSEAACIASGLKLEDINHRSNFSDRQISNLVTAVRKLENLKGRTRRTKLREIYHKNDENRRIIQYHFESLERLAAQEGIDPQVVALETYRDEADVNHDLDKLEQAGKPLCFDTLRRGHKRLYNVIKETGWGHDRLETNRQQAKNASRPGSGEIAKSR